MLLRKQYSYPASNVWRTSIVSVCLSIWSPNLITSSECQWNMVSDISPIEPLKAFHLKYLKIIIGVSQSTPIFVVSGETGWFPLYLRQIDGMLKLWAQIEQLLTSDTLQSLQKSNGTLWTGSWYMGQTLLVNTLRPRQNGRHFADGILKCIFLNENIWIPIEISLKFVPQGPINDIPSLVQIMAWRLPGAMLLSGPMMDRLPMHISVTWCQWVKHYAKNHDLITQMQCVLIHLCKTPMKTITYHTRMTGNANLNKEWPEIFKIVYI